MTPEAFRDALKRLGLTHHTAAEALRMGKWGWQTVSAWASGEKPVPGAVQVALELMLEKKDRP